MVKIKTTHEITRRHLLENRILIAIAWILIAILFILGLFGLWLWQRPDYSSGDSLQRGLYNGKVKPGDTAEVTIWDLKENPVLGYEAYTGENVILIGDYGYEMEVGGEYTITIRDAHEVLGNWLVNYTLE